MMGQFLDMVLPEMGNHVNGLIHMDMLVWQINISSKVSLKNILFLSSGRPFGCLWN